MVMERTDNQRYDMLQNHILKCGKNGCNTINPNFTRIIYKSFFHVNMLWVCFVCLQSIWIYIYLSALFWLYASFLQQF